jgi:hypothetical protein
MIPYTDETDKSNFLYSFQKLEKAAVRDASMRMVVVENLCNGVVLGMVD